jgi:glycosyltransferase involved in cell wall biosynthesis
VNSFLYITPYFPPGAQIGAKRALGLVRHLPALGWQPVVLASPNLTGRNDPQLRRYFPHDLKVDYGFRWFLRPLVSRLAKMLSRDRGIVSQKSARKLPHVTPLDQYMWDIPGAVISAGRLLREYGCRAVVVNADPWSGLIVGALVARWFKVPLILDLRDPWSISLTRGPLRPRLVQSAIEMMERGLFSSAAAVVLNTETCRRRYEDHYGRSFHSIRNAFDQDLLGMPGEQEPGFFVHYFGPLSRLADPVTVLQAFQQFADLSVVNNPRLVFYGPPEDQEHLDRDLIEFRSQVGLAETVPALSKASVLVIDRGPQDELQLPLKLYDYLAVGVPILALSDHDELNLILEETGAGVAVPFGDVPGTVEALRGLSEAEPGQTNVAAFGADVQAARFAELLERVVSRFNPKGTLQKPEKTEP